MRELLARRSERPALRADHYIIRTTCDVPDRDSLIREVLKSNGYLQGSAAVDFGVHSEATKEEYAAALVQTYMSEGIQLDSARSKLYDFSTSPSVQGVLLALFHKKT